MSGFDYHMYFYTIITTKMKIHGMKHYISDYIDKLMDEVMDRRKTLNSYQECREDLKNVMMSSPKPVCHKYPAVNKEAVVSAHKSRFAKL